MPNWPHAGGLNGHRSAVPVGAVALGGLVSEPNSLSWIFSETGMVGLPAGNAW